MGGRNFPARSRLTANTSVISVLKPYRLTHTLLFGEGSDFSSDKANVIVTDGFTGNIALKTAEGTANLIKRFFMHGSKSGKITTPKKILCLVLNTRVPK